MRVFIGVHHSAACIYFKDTYQVAADGSLVFVWITSFLTVLECPLLQTAMTNSAKILVEHDFHATDNMDAMLDRLPWN